MINAIVLAAGSSLRMGDINKLLLPYKTNSVIRTIVQNLQYAGIQKIIVVTGYEPDKIKAQLNNLSVEFVHNPDHLKGITSSIQKGVIKSKGNGYMICLADMLMISPADYIALKHAFDKQVKINEKSICVPYYQGKRGNPVIFSAYYKKRLLSHDDTQGCKNIIFENKENVFPVKMMTDHVIVDMDYYNEYRILLADPE